MGAKATISIASPHSPTPLSEPPPFPRQTHAVCKKTTLKTPKPPSKQSRQRTPQRLDKRRKQEVSKQANGANKQTIKELDVNSK